ncbi:MAG: flagellar assembly protein FliX [Alphaproteobacteria bacterium]|jgi:hypothetical protein|nr:flagellar assembly protein FliX [Alphaproteobacteria bacterium]MDP7223046.1 flagellar assembly protein FliX [Alphaproteobacteria bacterium]
MKIDKTSSTGKTGKTDEKKKVSTGDKTFSDMVSGGASETSGTSESQSIYNVDALLAVQAAEDPTQKAARKRMQQRASSILDELESIRMGLLTGTLTVGDIINVADVVASHREKVVDPQLTSLLDEIDLRAQVEIAKVSAALAR